MDGWATMAEGAEQVNEAAALERWRGNARRGPEGVASWSAMAEVMADEALAGRDA